MTFASDSTWMLFASTVTVAAISAGGCIATSTIEFSEDENLPPSVVSQEDALYPLREIGQLDLDVPVEAPELPLEVIVRDPNIDQTLVYRIFLDSTNPPSNTEFPIDQDVIPPSGELERPRTFTVSYDLLTAGVCHKIELTVTGGFAGFIEPRRPEQEGDIDNRTWWIEVTDADNPVITVECQ
jgi:hypothetical protein